MILEHRGLLEAARQQVNRLLATSPGYPGAKELLESLDEG